MSTWEENNNVCANDSWEFFFSGISDSIIIMKSSYKQLKFERLRFAPYYVYIKIDWEKIHLEQVTTHLLLSLKTRRLPQFLHW